MTTFDKFLIEIEQILTTFEQSSFLSQKQRVKKSRKEIDIFTKIC
jgi:hypothetical protein